MASRIALILKHKRGFIMSFYHRSEQQSKNSVLHLLVSSLLILLAVPRQAHAYLDPGTGNVLVYVIISLVGALIYASKSAFYALLKMVGKKDAVSRDDTKMSQEAQKYGTLIIFSEGKTYWNNFMPVVEKLIERKFPFIYYSMDVDDPGLTIDSPYMNSKYIGTGSWAYSRLNKARAEIMLSTTPNIGAPGYPVKRSPFVKDQIHMSHGIDSIAFYHRESLDRCNTVLMSTPIQAESIRKAEEVRHLPAKKLVAAGLPYFDVLASRMPDPLPPTNGKTILIAPSWSTKSCIYVYGSDFIKELAEAGYDIILRPHPQSYRVEQKMLDDLHKKLDKYENIVWDSDRDSTASMLKADLLISDTSSIRLDFALLYLRPVISLEMPIVDIEQWEMADVGDSWLNTVAAYKIGAKLNKDSIGNIVEEATRLLKEFRPEDLVAFRDETVANFRHSGEFIADYLIAELSASEQKQSQEA